MRAHRTYQRIRKNYGLNYSVITESGTNCNAGKYIHQGVEVNRITGNTGFARAFYETGMLLLKLKINGLNYIHAMGMSYTAISAAIWSQILGISLVRELTVAGEIPSGTGLNQILCRSGFTRADLSISLNHEIRNEYIKAGVSDNKIWLRPNPVDTSVFYAPTLEQYITAREICGFKHDKTVHLVLARFQPRKNQLLAVQSLARLPDTHCLILAGPVLSGDQQYYNSVLQAISTHRLEERVTVKPDYIRNPIQLFHAADTYWVPSKLEGMPNTMNEALCTGLPVVVNSDLKITEFIKHEHVAFEARPDPVEFASAALIATDIINNFDSRVARADKIKVKLDADVIDRNHVNYLSEITKKL